MEPTNNPQMNNSMNGMNSMNRSPLPPLNRLPEKKNHFGALIVLFILVILGAAAYYCYASNLTTTSTEVSSYTPPQHQATQPESTDDLTADINSATTIDNSDDLKAIDSEFKN